MAIDTASKRFSLVGIANCAILHNIPAGSVDAAKRATLLMLYEGIALDAPAAITITDVYNLVQDVYDLVDDLTTDVADLTTDVADLTADVAALTATVDAQTDTIDDDVIPKLEALQACCNENTKNGVSLGKENNSIKRDLKLLIASTERMKKGRL